MREPASTAYQAASRDLGRAGTALVWDWPLRLWHWALALLIVTAWVTPNRYDGLHRVAGYSVIGLLLFRLIWGFAGTRHARFRTLGVKLRAAPRFLRHLSRGRPGRYRGLNPAGAVMLVALLLLLSLSTLTGAMQVTVTFFGMWWVEDTHAWVSEAVMILVVLHVVGVVVVSVLQRENLVRAMITGRKRGRGLE